MINMPGGPELMLIVVVALVVLGPQQLPKAMKTFGSVMAEIRKVSSGFQDEVRSAMDGFTDDSAHKPQSGSMAAAEPAAIEPPARDDVIEVVARNPDEPPASDDEGPATARPARPPIDPADRAAG